MPITISGFIIITFLANGEPIVQEGTERPNIEQCTKEGKHLYKGQKVKWRCVPIIDEQDNGIVPSDI